MASCTPGPVEAAVGHHPQANGLVIIISNDYCGTSLDPLTGTHKDGERMKKTFESIDFAAVHQCNVTLTQLQQVTYEATQVVKYPESYKSICFVFSGHGGCDTDKDGRVVLSYLYDQTETKMKINTIMSQFMPKAAPRIGNIPKLFFIDACRGDKEMHSEAVVVPKSGPGSSGAVHDSKGGTVKVHLSVPSEGNYLVAYSTTEKYQSYEVKHKGGIWLEALSDMIREKAATESITNILTDVNTVLLQKYQDTGYRKAMTQPDFSCKLQHTLFLVPKAHNACFSSPPGIQRSMSQEGGVSPKSSENSREFLNRTFQEARSISKPEFPPKPEETSDGLFIGKVTFTIKESGEEVSFYGEPKKSHKETNESAAKQASGYLISRGLVNKSGAKVPSSSWINSSSASPMPTKVDTQSSTASPSLTSSPNSGKPPVMQLKEYCEKNKLEYTYTLVMEQGQIFQFKVTILRGSQKVMECIGEERGNKQDAKHSAAEKILARLH